MTQDSAAWLAEQKEIWGDGSDFRRVNERLIEHDIRLHREAGRIYESGGTAAELAAVVLGVMAPQEDESPALKKAMERYRARESDLLADLSESMRAETILHNLTWRVSDAFMCGFRSLGPAVVVFPDGYNASAQA